MVLAETERTYKASLLTEARLSTDRLIAITGASSGIGKATALALGRLGAKLVLGARHEDALTQVVEEVRAAGGQATYRVTDVSRREDLLELVQHAKASFGRLDVLFSNAGAMPIGPFDDLAVMIGSHGGRQYQRCAVRESGGPARLPPAGIRALHSYGIHGGSEDNTESGGVFGHEGGGPRALRWTSSRASRTDPCQHHTAGFTDTAFSEHVKSPELKEHMQKAAKQFAMSPDAVANAIVYILQQPDGVNVGEVTFRSKAQP